MTTQASPLRAPARRPAPITLKHSFGVTVTGLVRRPAAFAWSKGMTLGNAIAVAGGLADGAKLVVLIRLGSEPETFEIEGAPNASLEPGDDVRVLAGLLTR